MEEAALWEIAADARIGYECNEFFPNASGANRLASAEGVVIEYRM